jgi:hypothetical protein
LGLPQAADRSNLPTDLFYHGLLGRILAYGDTGFHGFKRTETQLLFLLSRQEDDLPSTCFGDSAAGYQQKKG